MKTLKVVLASMILAAALGTSPALAAIEVEGNAYIGYFDKYLWRGFDLSGGLPVVQGGVDLSSGGFTLSYWSNIQTKDDDTDRDGELDYTGGDSNETDIIIDYTFSPMDKLSVSVGNIWYALDGAEDTKEVYLGLTADVLLSPEFKVYYDYDMAKEDGLFYTASVGHTFDLSEKLSLSLGALVSYNQESDYAVYYYDEASDSDKTFSDWHNYELSASLTYALTDQLSITPSFLFSSPISDEAKKAIDSEVLGGVTVSFSF
jgi:uncharacterized protein (TIGR02001 family)